MPRNTNGRIDPYKVYLRRENERLERVYEQECRRQERVRDELDQKIQQLDQLLARRARIRAIIAQRIRELDEELQDQNGNKNDQSENKD